MVHLIHRGVLDRLTKAARPANFKTIDLRPIAESEMNGLGRLRQIAAGRLYQPGHDVFARVELHESADRVPIAFSPLQTEGDVIFLGKVISEIVRIIIEVVYNEVQSAVAVEIGHRGAA